MVLQKPKSVGKKLNKKDLLSTNLATRHGYCTQHKYINTLQHKKMTITGIIKGFPIYDVNNNNKHEK